MTKIIKYYLIISFILAFRLTFAQLPDIVAMEYYFDADPGFGLGIEVPIAADSLIDVNFDADLSAIGSGFHIIYVRVMNENGKWSLVHTDGFLKPINPPVAASPEILPDILKMEYFFDFDPGFGNGIEVPIAQDSLVDFNFDLSAIGSGFHIIYVRVMNENGNWSLVLTEGFLKIPNPPTAASPDILPQLVQMEYFFDADPGFGNGTDVPIAQDSLVDAIFDIDLSEVSSGFHIVHVRVKDEYGNWSLVFTEGILKIPDPPIAATPDNLPQISQMEYFFDADPGFGNGIVVPFTSDSLVEIAFDADFNTLDNGLHNLYVRVKDEFGKWSLLYSEDLFKFSPPEAGAAEQLPDIIAMEYFFDNDPGFGNGNEILNTPDSIVVESFIADIAMLGGGTHMLFTRVMDENNHWSLSAITPFCLQGIQLYLEGPYNSNTGLMSTALNDSGLLPLEQPFDSDPAADWYYSGNEAVTSIPNTDIVDWLLLQARDATSPDNATAASVKENQVAFLLNNGKIVGLDGESLISFSEPITNELFLVVFQRNHLGVISSSALDTSGDCECSYNFTIGSNQVYGGENGHKEISSNVWGMISGDGNGNGEITNDDKTVVWKTESGNAGYFFGDFNLNGQVDNIDKNEQWKTNNNSGSQVPD